MLCQLKGKSYKLRFQNAMDTFQKKMDRDLGREKSNLEVASAELVWSSQKSNSNSSNNNNNNKKPVKVKRIKLMNIKGNGVSGTQ